MNTQAQLILDIIAKSVDHTMTFAQVGEETKIDANVILGQVSSLKKSGFVAYANGAIVVTDLGMANTTDGKKETASKVAMPAGTVNGAAGAAPATAKVRAPREPNPDSKKAKAEALLRANPDLRRKDKIEMLVDHAGLTQQGASTYIYNFDKANKTAITKVAATVATAVAEPVQAAIDGANATGGTTDNAETIKEQSESGAETVATA